MQVLGVRRNTANKPDFVDEIYSFEELDKVLARADYLILAVPLTDQTRHMINRETLAKMKPNAYLLNVGRGELVDTQALIDALRSKMIAAAGLDTMDPEPLPQDLSLIHIWSIRTRRFDRL